jgi:hypothetical protein
MFRHLHAILRERLGPREYVKIKALTKPNVQCWFSMHNLAMHGTNIKLKSRMFKNIVCTNRYGGCEFQALCINGRSFLYNLTQLICRVELAYNVIKGTKYFVSL